MNVQSTAKCTYTNWVLYNQIKIFLGEYFASQKAELDEKWLNKTNTVKKLRKPDKSKLIRYFRQGAFFKNAQYIVWDQLELKKKKKKKKEEAWIKEYEQRLQSC